MAEVVQKLNKLSNAIKFFIVDVLIIANAYYYNYQQRVNDWGNEVAVAQIFDRFLNKEKMQGSKYSMLAFFIKYWHTTFYYRKEKVYPKERRDISYEIVKFELHFSS